MQEKKEKKQTITQEILSLVQSRLKDFLNWLKPSPHEHWVLQALKLLSKIPVVIIAIALSPLLLVVMLLVFLIAL